MNLPPGQLINTLCVRLVTLYNILIIVTQGFIEKH